MKKGLRSLIFIIPLIIFGAGFTRAQNHILKVAFLDIGQGDSIYIEAPNGNQMIIDGGPKDELSKKLQEVMPFGDKSINVLMVTNPDTDHYSGFFNILRDYEVGAVVESGTVSKTKTYQKFGDEIKKQGIPNIIARKNMTINLDSLRGVQFTVLFPDRDVEDWTTNDGSIEGILSYGKTKIMFTGDGTKKTEGILVSENKTEILKSDILKVVHHGSATSSSESFVRIVNPFWSVISVGKNNSYGLPKKVTLDVLNKYSNEVLRTDEDGTIIFCSDGNRFVRKNP